MMTHIESSHQIIPADIKPKDPIIVDQETKKVTIQHHTSASLIHELLLTQKMDINVEVNEAASVNYALLGQIEGHELELHFFVERDARITISSGLVGSGKVRYNVHLLKQGADAEVNIIGLSQKDERLNIHVQVNHMAKNTKSQINEIGFAHDQSRLTLVGEAIIQKGMSQSQAYQMLRGIITSDQALAEVNPLLLIDEHDVSAGHGATIGKLSDEGLYYLMSRGLDKTAAEKLIIAGYVKPLIDNIPNEALKEKWHYLLTGDTGNHHA